MVQRAARAALATFIAVMVSGPIGFLIVMATHPQPAWEGAETFAASYHPIQVLPYVAGFALVASSAWLITELHVLADARLRFRTTLALVFTAAFAALVVFNYLVQTTYVPQLARSYTHADDAALATFSMANPRSLAWCVELWAYALLGAATWLVAPVFARGGLQLVVRALFVANGPISIATPITMAIRPGWMTTLPGLVAFMAWNVLFAAMALLAFVVFRTSRDGHRRRIHHAARRVAASMS